MFLLSLARWIRYAYFLRFSLFIWLFPLIMIGLNATPVRTITSGLVTPEYCGQYICVSFFLVTASFVALILARVIVINGGERLNAEPPQGLRLLLSNDDAQLEWLAVILSQIPNAITYVYFWRNGMYEGVTGCAMEVGLTTGTLLAFFIWGVINAAYYLTYEMPKPPGATVILGSNAARTILFPRFCFRLAAPNHPVKLDSLEGAETPLSRAGINNWLLNVTSAVENFPGTQGYLFPGRGFYEGHAFSLIALVGFSLLYLAMWPMTAPVRLERLSWIFFWIFLVTPAMGAILLFLTSKPGAPGGLARWRVTQAVFVSVIVGFLTTSGLLYRYQHAERFPILALILILVIVVAWALAGAAFFLDRYRVPVITTMIVVALLFRTVTFVPHLGGWIQGQDEHFLSTTTGKTGIVVRTPREILQARLNATGGGPLIIVTATGGGLHASAWTASILGKLEQDYLYQATSERPSFHSQILLASTVSGGSVGLLSYLSELQRNPTDGEFQSQRVIKSAQCSSIEAVGWGLVYYDLGKAVIPIIPSFFPHSNGIDDLDQSPLFKDRTWSLRKGFVRNLNDEFCETTGGNVAAHGGNQLSLENMLATGSDPRVPAFTMNTTTVEGGSRFLLSNYSVPRKPELGTYESFPAESFLDLYGRDSTPTKGNESKRVSGADLPLATAAQLSATFPYISSAARIPSLVTPDGLHFIDGGYYDNDGTGSAIEFLRSALDERSSSPKSGGTRNPVRVLLVEIRNSPDIDNGENCQGDAPAAASKPADSAWQLSAPLLGFWNGGHESVTERNRVGLDLLLKQFPDDLRLERVVFDDRESQHQVHTDPLNWSLTPTQRREVAGSVQTSSQISDSFERVKTCLKSPESCWTNRQGENTPKRTCSVSH